MSENMNCHLHLREIFTAERKLHSANLSKIDISPGQPKMLHYIAKNNGCIQKNIAEATGIEPPSATSILSIMERNGLIRREKGTDDRRRLHVFITDKGREKLTQIHAIDEEIDKVLLCEFSPEERAQFFEFCDRLVANAKKASPCDKQHPEGF